MLFLSKFKVIFEGAILHVERVQVENVERDDLDSSAGKNV